MPPDTPQANDALAFDSQPQQQTAGIIVEKEGDQRQEGAPVEYGPNFEKLHELRPELSAALHYLVYTFNQEDLHARRDEIRRIREAREFWKGLHYLYWDEETQNYELPFQVAGQKPKDSDEIPRYSYVTNFYQAFGLSIIAVFSRKAPNVKLWPQSAQQPEDVATAKTGGDIIEVIKKNNRVAGLLTSLAYLLYVDGTVGGYIRYVVDGDRFGYHQEDQIEEQQMPLEPDKFVCPNCGAENPVQGQPGMINLCVQCETPLDESSFVPAQQVPVPVVTGQMQMPNGQEEITFIGKDELKIPSWATRFADFPYLQWQTEVHTSKLRAMYPHVSKEIKINAAAGASLGSEAQERETRLALRSGKLSSMAGDPSSNLVTHTRTWIRPWAFYLLDDETLRDELLQMFPQGCYVAFAGDTYCESRSESMNDHWRILHAYPGDGQSRPAMGDSIIPINKRFNDLSNIQQETYDFGIPPTYVDNAVIDRQALGIQKALPMSFYFVKGRQGFPLSNAFFTPPSSQVGPEMVECMRDLMGPIAQFLTGAFPALFGGEMESNDTASGYAMARDQAMGRLGLVWEAIKEFWADLMMLGIECFRKNRTGDVEIALAGNGGKWDSKFIKEADLKGNLYATAELDETFPQMWSQLRATLMQLMESQDPYVQGLLGTTSNVKLAKRVIGLDQFTIPEEDSETKQYREIEMMKMAAPTVAPGAPVTDPETGEPQAGPDGLPATAPPKFVSSVPIDPLVDDHETEGEVCLLWMRSDEGQLAKYETPQWYLNVRAHYEQHKEQAQIQQLEQMMMQAPAVEPSGGNKKPAPAGGGK